MTRSSPTIVTRWWWVRHAPVHGHDGRIYGQRDHAADTSGHAAFEALARRLPGDAVWVTSHLSRTRQTARAIAAAGLEIPEPIVEPAIAEQHLGVWEGLTQAELSTAKNGAYHRFWLAPAAQRPANGESFEDVVARVGTAIAGLTAAHLGRNIVAIAHGGTIRAALCHALGLHPEAALGIAVGHLSLTCMARIEGPGEGRDWQILMVNRPAV